MVIQIDYNQCPRHRGITKLHINPRQIFEIILKSRRRKCPRHGQRARVIHQFLENGGAGTVFNPCELDGASDSDGGIARCIVELAGIEDRVFVEVGHTVCSDGLVLLIDRRTKGRLPVSRTRKAKRCRKRAYLELIPFQPL